MRDSASLPLPVARAVASWQAAGDPGEHLLAAVDAAHALTKYVALVRLAAWWRSAPPADSRYGDLARGLAPLLWGESGAGPLAWWRLARMLEPLVPDLPSTPELGRIPQDRLEQLNTARRPRHTGSAARSAPSLLAGVTATLEALLDGAAPLLDVPLVVESTDGTVPLRGTDPPRAPGLVSVLPRGHAIAVSPLISVLVTDGAVDLYVFERDTTMAPIFENHGAPVLLDHGRPLVAALHRWAEAVAHAGVAAETGALCGDELTSRLRAAARRAAGRGMLGSAVDIPRAAADRALAHLVADGVWVQILVGASGVGKSHALRKLITNATRAPLWVRAVHWSGESLAELLGEAVCGVPGVALPAQRIEEVAAGPGLLIAVDGLNENADPGALVAAVTAPLRGLTSGSVHVVITSRAAAATTVLAQVQPTWLVAGTGCFELGALDDRDARQLVGERRYDELAPGTRRLLRVPLLGLLARDAIGDGADAFSVDRLVESFVWSNAGDLERALLRTIAARMVAQRSQVLSRASYDDTSATATALREGLSGEGLLGEAFARLLDRGLVTVAGEVGTRPGLRVAFGHDRMLQWMAGRWLASQPQDHHARSGAWGDQFDRLAHAPALALAVGYALLNTTDADQHVSRLASSDRAADRAVARAAIEVAAENAAGRATDLLTRAWSGAASREVVRTELVALAADLGEAAVIASALGDAQARDAAAFALSRIARHSSDTVAAALRERWHTIERRPWRRLLSTIRILHALLHARFGEGSSPNDPGALNEVARDIAIRLVGSSQGVLARGARSATLGMLATLVRGFATLAPQGPTSNILELLRMFHQPPAARAWLQPLVDVFDARIDVRDAAPVIRRVAGERSVGATILLERALIAASRRPAEADAALDLAIEAGALGCGQEPPTMAAQGGLYVLSTHLKRTPTSTPDWDRRFADFERGLAGWLTAAPRRRWLSESGRWYKSLFVAAHSSLHHQRYGTRRTELVDRLWGQVLLDHDVSLAMDLLDDLQIIAVSRGEAALALDAMEPLLASSWELPGEVHRECLELLRAIHERAPDVAEETLRRGDERPRLALARELRMGRACKTAGYAIFLDFDEAIILHDDLRGTIARVFDALLSMRSATAFVNVVLRMAANRVIGAHVFPGLPA